MAATNEELRRLAEKSVETLEEGWTQKKYYNEDHTAYCAVGALHKHSGAGNMEVMRELKYKLASKIGIPNEEQFDSHEIITKWNDAPERTKEEVIELFKEVIKDSVNERLL